MKNSKLIEKGLVTLFIVIVFLCAYSASPEKIWSAQTTDSELGLLIRNETTRWSNPLKTFVSGSKIIGSGLVYCIIYGLAMLFYNVTNA